MSTAAIQEIPSVRPAPSKGKKKHISWEKFQREYLTREDGYKYEWLGGTVEKTKRTMDYSQFNILGNLLDLFYQLKSAGKTNGQLIAEGDMFFAGKHRRPDIAYLSAAQMEEAKKGEKPVPLFVVEVISNNDAIRKVQQKMVDYRKAKVPVVWQVFPGLEEVHVYHGRNMTIYKGEEVCSAKPVLEGFEMKVKEVFK